MAEGVLAEIVRRKRSDVESRLAGASLDPQPTYRSLRSALAQRGARFIMEVKKQSPSGHRSAVDVASAVRAYAPVADAISVLTDGPYFGGSLDDLHTVRAGFDGPILAKDFVIDARQVSEARLHGADAVLAILSVLHDDEAAQVMAEARRLSMDVIVEVHDEAELSRALALGSQIIGINNRDLRTLKTDLSVTTRLAELIPDARIVISESGIRSRADIERLSTKVDAFLVGSSLMASPDILQAARALVFGPVKICGLTCHDDVLTAAEAGATYAGFIFAEESPRQVNRSTAELASEAHRCGLSSVGVFVRENEAEILRLADQWELRAVQLHGNQDARALRSKLRRHCEVWSVTGVGEAVEKSCRDGDRTVFDTRLGGRTGGTGKAFGWRLLAGHPDLARAFIAGGIGPTTARAAQRVGAYGLDVGSALEMTPGKKDEAKVKALFDALRLPSRRRLPC